MLDSIAQGNKLEKQANSLADFDKALRRVLSVTPDEMKRLLASKEAKEAVKQKRGPKKRPG